jgi:hypothetical protein
MLCQGRRNPVDAPPQSQPGRSGRSLHRQWRLVGPGTCDFATGVVGGWAERVECSLQPICFGSRFGEALVDPRRRSSSASAPVDHRSPRPETPAQPASAAQDNRKTDLICS